MKYLRLTASTMMTTVFGWLPVLLWVLIGGIFFGAVHDYGALFAPSATRASPGRGGRPEHRDRAKKLFLVFSYLTLVLVVAAFASIVASTSWASTRTAL